MAISINVKKGISSEEVSKFFGSPTVPADWLNGFDDEVIFLCQIRLADIAALDTNNILPHEGYLYIFLDTSSYPFKPLVRLYDGEPDTVIDDFNNISEEFSALTEGWEMAFSSAPDDSFGIRLFGVPYDWGYAGRPPKLFMQYDPLDTEIPFMQEIDGFLYFFYDKDITEMTLHIERT